MSEHSYHYATVTVLLEDVTQETAYEFWQRLDGQEIELRLDDGLVYVAGVQTVIPA